MPRSQLLVIDGKAACPGCHGAYLLHAYDVTEETTQFDIENGEVTAARGHNMTQCHNYRLLCVACGWTEVDCGLDVE